MRCLRIGWLAAALIAGATPAAGSGREPVLKQVNLPHPYYLREMYLPQLTSGPSSLAWSPDARELVYSMAGSLWRQRVDSALAEQLTDGPGYDYQPDWSPDGAAIVYASYQQDAVELWRLELASGRRTRLTDGGAVNVEPRYSPDGRRLAWVSTAFHGRFHLYAGELTPAGLERVARLTGETDSHLPRYYYSVYDHEISPVWTRDGESLLYVSNRGRIHGAGGFWQVAARPGAEPKELHYEETNWRARPDYSPDGARILYSSYLGGNWHQLWLMPASGGADAFPISYGDWDEVGARWSPDGRTIAFISNRHGNTELWLQQAVGGAQRQLAVHVRKLLKPAGRLTLRLLDASGRPAAARVSVTDAAGRFHGPADSWIHADDGFDRLERPFEAHYFHARGAAEIEMPAGELDLEIMRGFEQPLERRHLAVAAGGVVALVSRAAPRFHFAGSGERWVSGDVHVHMNYGGLYRNDPEHLIAQAEAEDLGIVHALIVNKEQRMPDIAYSGHGLDPASRPGTLLLHGQEFHTSYWGHLGILGPHGATQLPGYAGYPNTAAASLYPMNADVAERAHADGALVGYVHPFDTEPHPFDAAEPLSMELPVDVALGKVDYLEVLGFADHRTTAGVWYRLLNLGFRLPAAGGTDAMANFASLRGPVGMNRVYVRLANLGFASEDWLAGLKAGRSFATNGPLLAFTLGERALGDELKLAGPAPAVGYHAQLRSIVPLDHLEIVCNGRVVRSLTLSGERTRLDERGTLPLAASGWCLLRAGSDRAEHPVLDNYVYATTSPVYVTLAGAQPRSAADAEYFLAWLDRLEEATARRGGWNSQAEEAAVAARISAARAVYAARR